MTPAARATRARILAGAGRALARLGVRATAVKDILGEAEVSRRTFYQYFSSVDGVLVALYDQAMDDMLGHLEAAVRAAPEGQRLEAGVRAYLGFHQSQGALLTVLMSDALAPDSPLATRREQALGRFVEVVGAFSEASRGHRLDPLLVRALFSGLGTMVIGARRAGTLDQTSVDRLAAVMMAMISQVLSAGDRFPSVVWAGDVSPPDAPQD